MSATDQMRAMLDQLMGTKRDGGMYVVILTKNVSLTFLFQRITKDTNINSVIQRFVKASC